MCGYQPQQNVGTAPVAKDYKYSCPGHISDWSALYGNPWKVQKISVWEPLL
jgi:hypothetical protein